MALVLKMQIDDKQEHQYIFSTGEEGTIELIPLSVIENGTYTPEEENQAFNRVTVNVPQTVLEHLNITANGTYEASSGHSYDVVNVNVQPILDILSETINENGTYVYEPEQGYDGLEQVIVNVSVPEPLFEHLTQTITSNGTYNFTPTVGKDGFDEANITVNVPTPQPNLQTKTLTITQNGSSVVTPDTGYDGLDEVDLTVNVQGGGGSGDVITGTVTITDTNTYNECWVPMTIPEGKDIGAILVRSRDSTIYTSPSAWYRSIIQFGLIPSVSTKTNTKYKQRFSAYYNNASATTYTSEVVKSQSSLPQYLAGNLQGVVAFNSDYGGLGFKVKAEKGNTYGFAINTEVEYIVVLVDSE